MNENEIIEKRKKDLRDFLKLIDDHVKNRHEGYILANGTLFVGREPSENIKDLLFEPIMKQGHYNSQQLSIQRKFRYFEGYAMDTSVPMEHAWCVADNKVIDVTWTMLDDNFNTNHDKTCIYYGIEIPVDFVWNNQLETSMAEPVILKYLHSIGYDGHGNASTNSFSMDT
ncbi:MAG: hypothetical protein OI718_00065 (plasmid) [Candidatus Methanoperedens sp.]|nr:MAG: hypothetical protein OI718_00065 [Candidatus Methanoperedens sp.]